MDVRKSTVRCQNGSPQHWSNMSIGKSGFVLTARVNSLKSVISANFRFKTPTSKAVYHQFYSDKEAIEKEFGGVLEWNESPEGKESYVTVTKDKADFRNDNDWENQFTWLADKLECLDKVFRKRVKKIDSD